MNYYEILGIDPGSSEEDIRIAYRAMVKKYHPDVYPGDQEYATRMTQQICEAYKTLSNPEKRDEYDKTHPTQKDEMETRDSEKENSDTIFCWKCGRPNPADADFCVSCGAKMTEEETVGVTEEETIDSGEDGVQYRRQAGKTRRFMFWLPLIVLGPFLLIMLINMASGKQHPMWNSPTNGTVAVSTAPASQIPVEIALLEKCYLTDYSTSRTIGEAFNSFFGAPTWQVVQGNDRTAVLFSGKATDADINESVTVNVVFVKYGDSFQVASWQRDGVVQNNSSLPLLLRKIYE